MLYEVITELSREARSIAENAQETSTEAVGLAENAVRAERLSLLEREDLWAQLRNNFV